MTLMKCGNSDGERRCDERCYSATGGTCDCVCGGANHGKGLAQALVNTHGYAIEVNEAAKQTDLFLKPTIVMKLKGRSPWE